MAFKDKAHTKDRIRVGLSIDTAGACKGHQLDAPTCIQSERPRARWCSYCKAKTPN